MIGLLAAVALVVDVPMASAGDATNIDVQLRAGASISGTIRDPNGVPVGGAQVIALGALPEHYDVTDVDTSRRIRVSRVLANGSRPTFVATTRR